MFEINPHLLQNITATVFLALFAIGRFTWSKLKGKRKRKDVSFGIVFGRSVIQILLSGVIPIMLIIDAFEIKKHFSIYGYFIPGLYFFGLILSLLGITCMFLARFHRQKDWGYMGDSTGEVLFTKGIYAVTRHPYYVGAILVGVGIYLILNSWLVLLMLPVVLFVKYVIKKEDEYLLQKFKDQWLVYRKKVGIIPFI